MGGSPMANEKPHYRILCIAAIGISILIIVLACVFASDILLFIGMGAFGGSAGAFLGHLVSGSSGAWIGGIVGFLLLQIIYVLLPTVR